jgi:hypothetical protein
MVSRLTLRRGAEVDPPPLDHPRLSRGWWDLEGDRATCWRWTDGNATIELTTEGLAVLEIALGGGLHYPLVQGFETRPVCASGVAPAKLAAA